MRAKEKINFDWVTIPAGEFIMGSEDYGNEKPIHKVYLPEYQIMRTPVTNDMWQVFLQNSGYAWENINKDTKVGWKEERVAPKGREKHPVVYVTWYDAMAFCEWAGVRLPTEAEWEKGARGTDGRRYPWGNENPTAELCNFNRNIGDTTPVGKYPKGASPYGCLDMAGNVWEWTRSQYKVYPYQEDDGRNDTNILTSNSSIVLRGGSWIIDATSIRTTIRYRDNPTVSNFIDGFRCSRS